MSLKTRYGNLGNVYDENPSQTQILQLESPLLLSAEFQALLDHFGRKAASIDCTFETDAGPGALRAALERIRVQAEDAVREGYEQIVLSDEATLGGARADSHDPRGRRGAQPSGAPGPAQLQLDHRALGRVPGRPLRRGPDRGRRHRGQSRISRKPRSPSARRAACFPA